jgi:hypothetical protein
MYLKFLFLSVITAIICCFCKSPDNDLFEFDPRTLEENEFSLSEIADDIVYIPLDNGFPLGYSADFVFTDTAIYFRSYDIGILVYDRKGRFIRKIGSIGRGPGEYVGYTNFTVDHETGTIYNLDIGNIIKVYSSDGQFIRSFPSPEFGGASLGFFNNKLFINYAIQFGNVRYDWIVIDTSGNVIRKQERKTPVFTANFGGSGYQIYRFEDRISYWNNYTDTVYSVLPDLTEEPSFFISPGEYRLPRTKFPLSQFSQIASGKLMIKSIFETSRFFVIQYTYKRGTLVLIDKYNHEILSNVFDTDEPSQNGIGIVNDLDNGLMFIPETYFKERDREYLLGIQYPNQIIARAASKEFKNLVPQLPDKKVEFEKLAIGLNATDNPVLVLVRLRKYN